MIGTILFSCKCDMGKISKTVYKVVGLFNAGFMLILTIIWWARQIFTSDVSHISSYETTLIFIFLISIAVTILVSIYALVTALIEGLLHRKYKSSV